MPQLQFRDVELKIQCTMYRTVFGTQLGSLRRCPRPLVGWGGGHPSPFPPLDPLQLLDLDGASLVTPSPNTNSWLRHYTLRTSACQNILGTPMTLVTIIWDVEALRKMFNE